MNRTRRAARLAPSDLPLLLVSLTSDGAPARRVVGATSGYALGRSVIGRWISPVTAAVERCNLMNRPTAFEVHQAGTLLHGTKAELAIGDLLVPGYIVDRGSAVAVVFCAATIER